MQTSYAATATGAVAGAIDAGVGNTWKHLAIKMLAPYSGQGPASGAQVALETSPDNTAWTPMALAVAASAPWGVARIDHAQRYARVNVVSLGTATAVAAVICCTR